MTKNHDDLAALSPAHEASSYQAMPARLGTPGVRAVVIAPVGRFERDVGRDQIVNVGQFQPLPAWDVALQRRAYVIGAMHSLR